MPILKIDHVVSFSSEDPVHSANNLLSSDPAKKWKCKSTGEKSAIVVLQLEKASVISAIDIGNENSAYVEVLATRSGMGDTFKVLLVMSSLMSPLEARQTSNINRVRMFTKDNLSKPECEQKWDRIKIVCTQPFNRHVQYGLSFITLHSSDSDTPSQSSQTTIGKFTLRPASPDLFSAGNLFSRIKEEEKKEPSSLAAAIKKADHSSDPLPKPQLDITEKLKKKDDNKSPQQSPYNSPKPRNKISLLYDEEEQKITPSTSKAKDKESDETSKPKNVKDLESKPKKDKESDKTPKRKNEDDTARENKPKKPKATPFDAGPSTSKIKNNGTSIHRPKKAKPKPKLTKPFNRLLEGVVIVISGIQNPDRANLRSKALALGAKYSGDWHDRCTHLICAFLNTPKFNQVKGKGKIVTKKWIEECYNQRKRLPWRRFCLDKNDKKQDESEEEVCEEAPDEVDSGSDTDIDNQPDDGSDTEERINRIQESLKKQKDDNNSQDESNIDQNEKKIIEVKDKECEPNGESNGNCDAVDANEDNVYDADTDPEGDFKMSDSEVPEPEFKDFFSMKRFFVDSRLDKNMFIKLSKYIIAYGGLVIDDPTEDIDVYITDDPDDDVAGEFFPPPKASMSPNWVWACHNEQRLIPFDEHNLKNQV